MYEGYCRGYGNQSIVAVGSVDRPKHKQYNERKTWCITEHNLFNLKP